jgi:hypothetical protein
MASICRSTLHRKFAQRNYTIHVRNNDHAHENVREKVTCPVTQQGVIASWGLERFGKALGKYNLPDSRCYTLPDSRCYTCSCKLDPGRAVGGCHDPMPGVCSCMDETELGRASRKDLQQKREGRRRDNVCLKQWSDMV